MIINPIIYGSSLQTHNTTYLYYRGDENEPLTGGWAQSNYKNDSSYISGGLVQKSTKFVRLWTKTGSLTPVPSNKYACLTTANQIDVSDYVSWGTISSFYSLDSGATLPCVPKISIATTPYLTDAAEGATQYTAVLSPTYNAPENYDYVDFGIAGRNKFAPFIGYNADSSIHTLQYSPCKTGYITVSSFYTGNQVLYVAYLAKHDNLAPLSQYGVSIEEILSNAEALLNDPVAVSRMARYCTGDFMWAAVQNSDFLTALLNSPYGNYVFRNEEWGKPLFILSQTETNLLFDSDGEYLMDSEGYLLYSTS
jgi:hypothetical protein